MLTLNSEGRYITSGPARGKVNYLTREGAKLRRPPRRFPLAEGKQLIVVIENVLYDTALWVTDEADWQLVRHQDRRRLVWLEMDNEPLLNAHRQGGRS